MKKRQKRKKTLDIKRARYFKMFTIYDNSQICNISSILNKNNEPVVCQKDGDCFNLSYGYNYNQNHEYYDLEGWNPDFCRRYCRGCVKCNPDCLKRCIEDSLIIQKIKIEQWNKQIIIIKRFRFLYYCIKLKDKFRYWLWIRVRQPKIAAKYHPQNLSTVLYGCVTDDDMFKRLNEW